MEPCRFCDGEALKVTCSFRLSGETPEEVKDLNGFEVYACASCWNDLMDGLTNTILMKVTAADIARLNQVKN